jgi:hypothetical protein
VVGDGEVGPAPVFMSSGRRRPCEDTKSDVSQATKTVYKHGSEEESTIIKGTTMLARGRWPPGLGFGYFTARISRSLLTHHHFDDDLNIPAAERARSRYSNARCVYPSSEHRKRRLRYSTRSNRSRFRKYPLDHDSSPFPPTPLQRPAANS